MAKKKQRSRPYAIDTSVPLEPSTGSTLDIVYFREGEEKVDNYVSADEATGLNTPGKHVAEEEEIDKKFIEATGKTIYDVVFYLLGKLSGKSYQILLLGGFFVAFFTIRPDTWDKWLIASVSTVLWSVVIFTGMGIQSWLLRLKIKAGEK